MNEKMAKLKDYINMLSKEKFKFVATLWNEKNEVKKTTNN